MIDYEYSINDFSMWDTWCKDNDNECVVVRDVQEFWAMGDDRGATYFAIGVVHSTVIDEDTERVSESYWPLPKFNKWVKGAVRTHKGDVPILPNFAFRR